ncbi:phosphatidylinositol-specific phospholipase C [Methylomonas sp. CM2]|uniref:phosphatidylinositol-specific phospholipase C n=1 Tax=Methylomonas sp. CM2 TaxID=3417647 RepID=UPI003CEE5729
MKLKSTFAALTFASIACFSGNVFSGIDTAAYSHDAYIGVYNNEQWMKTLPDTLKLSELSLPGTHDSMARYGDDDIQTQSMSVADQLNSGIRVLDIRCWHKNDNLIISRAGVTQNATYQDVLNAVDDFLAANPSETVIMRVTEDVVGVNNTRSFSDTYNYIVGKFPGLFLDLQGTTNPTLGEMRGKAVLLQNYSGSPIGINYSEIYKQGTVQDNYKLKTNWDLYGKWEQVKAHFMAASTGDANKIYINFLDGGNGSFPYFVASGHSSHETNAAQLLTGLTTLTSPNTYPDFPRVGCLGKLCSIAFLGTNQLSSKFLADLALNYQSINQLYKNLNINLKLTKRMGIVMMDFPGRSLVNNIIAMNEVLLKKTN